MKQYNRLFGLLIVTLFHLSMFFIFQSSRQYTPIQSTITRVSLLNILSEPVHNPPTSVVPAAKPKPPISIKKTNDAQKRDQPQEHSKEIRESKAIQEPVISGLDAALNGTASSAATLPKDFINKKIMPDLKPKAEEKRTVLAKEIEKAVRPDCKTAYQGLGILAPVVLLHDTIRDKGCQW